MISSTYIKVKLIGSDKILVNAKKGDKNELNFLADFDDLGICLNCGRNIPNITLQNLNFECCSYSDKTYIISKYYPMDVIPDFFSYIIVLNKREENLFQRNILSEIFLWYLTNFAKNLKKSDLVIPMPGSTNHPKKELFFPQIDFITKYIAKELRIPYSLNAIKKDYFNGFQKGENSNIIADKNILLLEDVYTTGNTCRTCYNFLKSLKANKINIVVLAKTTREKP